MKNLIMSIIAFLIIAYTGGFVLYFGKTSPMLYNILATFNIENLTYFEYSCGVGLLRVICSTISNKLEFDN